MLAASRLNDVVRAAHGRLLAVLASRCRDIGLAEEGLSHSYRAALESWADNAVPKNAEGWLLRVATNHIIDHQRGHFHSQRESLFHEDGSTLELPAGGDEADAESMPDERLKLMFAAAHPAIDDAIRAPLILQTIFGLEAAEIAPLFCATPATMAQRLVRAKTKIRDARIPFTVPDASEWPERLEAVLEAVYGAFCAGFEDRFESAEQHRLEDRGLEAMYLSDLLAAVLPKEPEALGLAALISFSASRAATRTGPDGAYVPLEKQDTARWDELLIRRGAALLMQASKAGQLGRFQLEAAILSVHADRRRTGVIDWRAIAQLYEGLMYIAPTRGALVAQAYVVGKIAGPDAALKVLSALSDEEVEGFAPALACRAFLREQRGELKDASADYAKAAGLVTGEAVRAHLKAESARLRSSQ
jgi:predicted RNA polymerase sigma factor